MAAKKTWALLSLVCGAAFGALAAAGSAVAADISAPFVTKSPVAVAYNWTGCYVGAHGGYGWSGHDVSFVPLNNSPGTGLFDDVPPGAVSFNGRGATIGGQAGCNWQTSSWVFGVEGDVAAASITGKTYTAFVSQRDSSGLDSFSVTSNITGLATFRGRAGYTWGAGMVYLTGGGAWERLSIASNLASNAAPDTFATQGPANVSFDRWGYALGGGLEYMIAPHWTLRGEYLYYRFDGSNAFQSITNPCDNGVAKSTTCLANHATGPNSINEVRFGVNYLFSASGMN